jgi:hypothetical protein
LRRMRRRVDNESVLTDTTLIKERGRDRERA